MVENIEIKDEKDVEGKKLQEDIDAAKEKIKEYVRKYSYYGIFKDEEGLDKQIESRKGDIYEKFNHDLNFVKLFEQYNDCINALKFHELWKKFSPIKSTIEDLKKEIGFVDAQDRLEYIFNSVDDMFFLGFKFFHSSKSYSEKYQNLYTWDFDILSGCVAYDAEGHIYLLEKTKREKGYNSTSKSSGIFDNIPFYKQQFFDKECMCIDDDYSSTKLYKIVDGEYKTVHDFGRCPVSTTPELWEEKLLMIGSSNMYSVKEDRFISVSANNTGSIQSGYNNGTFIDSSREDINEDVNKMQQEVLSKYLKDNDLLISKYSLTVEYEGKSRNYKCICFVDKEGHITSKLFVISNYDLSCIEFEVTDETYDKVLYEVREYCLKELKTEVERQKAFEQSERNKEKQKTLLNQKKLYAKVIALCDNKN